MGEIAVHKQGWGFSGIPGKGKHKIRWVFLQRVLLTGLGREKECTFPRRLCCTAPPSLPPRGKEFPKHASKVIPKASWWQSFAKTPKPFSYFHYHL